MDPELNLWKHQWESHWKSIQEQHVQTVRGYIKLTNAEINKLKMNAVPNTVALTLIDLNKDKHSLLANNFGSSSNDNLHCKAKRSFLSLCQLKMYLRNTMGQER